MDDEKKFGDQLTQEETPQDAAPSAENTPQEAQQTDDHTPAQEDEMAKLQQDYNTLNDKLLRTLAEYDNYRKRTARERENIYPEAEAGILAKLLPFVDNFERAMCSECTDPEFKKGMDMILASLKDLLAGIGIEELGAPGESFDPNLHHAVLHVEDEELGENVIVEVLQKGYRRGDRLLRCAMVKTAN